MIAPTTTTTVTRAAITLTLTRACRWCRGAVAACPFTAPSQSPPCCGPERGQWGGGGSDPGVGGSKPAAGSPRSNPGS